MPSICNNSFPLVSSADINAVLSFFFFFKNLNKVSKYKHLLESYNVSIYFLQVIVKEAQNQSHVATASVLLKLIDMNDNNPLFEENSYTFYIKENSNYSTDVGHIKVRYTLRCTLKVFYPLNCQTEKKPTSLWWKQSKDYDKYTVPMDIQDQNISLQAWRL